MFRILKYFSQIFLYFSNFIIFFSILLLLFQIYKSFSETKVVQEFSKVTTATGSEGTGDFAFEIKMYQDFDFVEPVSAKDVIMVGDSVFFAVEESVTVKFIF
jgi:hypothetical protein